MALHHTRGGFQGEGISGRDTATARKNNHRPPLPSRRSGVADQIRQSRASHPRARASYGGGARKGSRAEEPKSRRAQFASPFSRQSLSDGPCSLFPVRDGPAAHLRGICDLFRRPLGNLLSGTKDIQLDMPPLFSSGRYTQDVVRSAPDRGPRCG